MSKFKVNSKSMQTNATYTDENYKVEVNYTTDVKNELLASVSGTIYKGEAGNYAGNFHGNANAGGEMEYSFNGIKATDMVDVVTMLMDIEEKIKTGEE